MRLVQKKIFIAIAVVFLLFNSCLVQSAESKILTSRPQNVDFSEPKLIDNLVGHFNNKVEIVFSDIDGTIVPFNDKGIQPLPTADEHDAVLKLSKAKIPLVITSGRTPNEIKEIVDVLGCDNTYFILQQGGLILNPKGEAIYTDFLGNKETKAIVNEFLAFRKSRHLTSKYYVVANGKQYSTEPFTLSYNGRNISVVKSLDDFGDDFCFGKMEVYDTNIKNLKLIQADLKKKYPNFRIDISGAHYCCITSPTATKGNAVLKLSQMLKVDLKNAAVLGDAENDLSMFKVVKERGGIAIALGNAFDNVKAQASYVTSPVTEGGWTKAILDILENNKRISKNKKCSLGLVK